ncbi:HdaA/DnaA family protein [Aestuariibius sp. 2305UL40-4]|uniref:HdaA/DnaA family protein n=1 Tax=Aestuariibius violaceus TaxID=3234132 RepID=UPI00345E98CB
MAHQLVFPLPAHVALGAEDFFVSKANEAAYTTVLDRARWPDRRLVLTGPEASGKSHLVRILSRQAGAEVMPSQTLSRLARPPQTPLVVIEDADRIGTPEAEEALFHLHNHLASTGGKLLLTARTAPARWPLTLPDLASRMQAITPVTIDAPDDALLRVLLAKHFTDRQLNPPPDVIEKLATRIDRSFAAAARIVAHLDQQALAQQRQITWPFARTVLEGTEDAL